MARKRRAPLTRLERILRSDGALCVTFLNTAAAARKSLETYGDLLALGVETGALSAADSERLAGAAAEHPGTATGVVRRAATLRRRLERIFLAVAAGEQPDAADFDPFNTELRRAMGACQLSAPGGHEWAWGEISGHDLDRVLWPVLHSAGDLLASDDRDRLRQCPEEACGLWFLARGSGKPRRWCGAACRSRAASRRYYERKVKPKRQAD